MVNEAIWSAAIAIGAAVAGCGGAPSSEADGTKEDPTAITKQGISLVPGDFGGGTVNPPIGGNGGSTIYDLTCWKWNTVVSGFVVHDGDVIDSIALVCQPLNQDGTIGPSWYTNGPGGGSGGTAHHAQCPANQFARQMFYMTAGDYINCAYMDCETASGEGGYGWMYVGGTCTAFGQVDDCNHGSPYDFPFGAVTGLQMRSGSYIDSVQTLCTELEM